MQPKDMLLRRRELSWHRTHIQKSGEQNPLKKNNFSEKMLAKSLVIFICVGVLAGFLYGMYLFDLKNPGHLVYVDGSSISIVTEKSDFKKGEEIKIRIVNSGTTPLTFSD